MIMARKIRFGLNMPEKQNIRTIDELKQYFDLKTVLEYYFNNKLIEWLNDRGYTNLAEKINSLDRQKDDFEESICKIFEVQHIDKVAGTVVAEDVEELVDRKEEIRKYTDDINILENAENVVFSQTELNVLVKDDKSMTVYLLGEKFTLSCKYRNKNYIGLNNPAVKFSDIPEVALDELGIKIIGAKVLDNTIKITKEIVKTKVTHKISKRSASQGYKASVAFDFLLNDEQRAQSEKLFNCIEEFIGNYRFNPDVESDKLLKVIEKSDLKYYFKNYLNRLA